MDGKLGEPAGSRERRGGGADWALRATADPLYRFESPEWPSPGSPRPTRSPALSVADPNPSFFAQTPDFACLSAAAQSALRSASSQRRYDARDFIYLQDDEARYLYIVVSGHVRLSSLLEDGSVVLHAILPPGGTFGELGVFEASTYCDMATAIGPVVTAGITVQSFNALALRYPEIREMLARIVARRYREYVLLTRDLSLKSLSARLAQSVLRLAGNLRTRTHVRGREVALIGSAVTQTDLGLMARGSRGNVNRLLKSWERTGLIAVVDRCILILDEARLVSVAAEDC